MKSGDALCRVNVLAREMLMDVYYPLTLCVFADEEGNLLGLRQFDTLFCSAPRMRREHCGEIWLLSNHHDGDMRFWPEDLAHLDGVQKQYPQAICRLFIVSEDVGVLEYGE